MASPKVVLDSAVSSHKVRLAQSNFRTAHRTDWSNFKTIIRLGSSVGSPKVYLGSSVGSPKGQTWGVPDLHTAVLFLQVCGIHRNTAGGKVRDESVCLERSTGEQFICQ